MLVAHNKSFLIQDINILLIKHKMSSSVEILYFNLVNKVKHIINFTRYFISPPRPLPQVMSILSTRIPSQRALVLIAKLFNYLMLKFHSHMMDFTFLKILSPHHNHRIRLWGGNFASI